MNVASQLEGHVTPPQPSERRLRSRAANIQIDTPDDSEFFDLENVSGSDDDPPVQRARHNRTEDEPTVAQIINDPGAKPLKVSTAADVHYFFETIEEERVCKVCRYVFLLSSLSFSDKGNRKQREDDPANWIPKRYKYSAGSSNSSVRVHIENFHLEQFKQLAKEGKWKIFLKGLVSESRAQSQALASEASTLGQHVKFDERTFHRYLSNFIIVDDQVCLRLMLVAMLTFYLLFPHPSLSTLWTVPNLGNYSSSYEMTQIFLIELRYANLSSTPGDNALRS